MNVLDVLNVILVSPNSRSSIDVDRFDGPRRRTSGSTAGGVASSPERTTSRVAGCQRFGRPRHPFVDRRVPPAPPARVSRTPGSARCRRCPIVVPAACAPRWVNSSSVEGASIRAWPPEYDWASGPGRWSAWRPARRGQRSPEPRFPATGGATTADVSGVEVGRRHLGINVVEPTHVGSTTAPAGQPREQSSQQQKRQRDDPPQPRGVPCEAVVLLGCGTAGVAGTWVGTSRPRQRFGQLCRIGGERVGFRVPAELSTAESLADLVAVGPLVGQRHPKRAGRAARACPRPPSSRRGRSPHHGRPSRRSPGCPKPQRNSPGCRALRRRPPARRESPDHQSVRPPPRTSRGSGR